MISDEFVSIAIQPIQLGWKLILSKEELANDPRIEMMLVGTKENWLSSSNLPIMIRRLRFDRYSISLLNNVILPVQMPGDNKSRILSNSWVSIKRNTVIQSGTSSSQGITGCFLFTEFGTLGPSDGKSRQGWPRGSGVSSGASSSASMTSITGLACHLVAPTSPAYRLRADIDMTREEFITTPSTKKNRETRLNPNPALLVSHKKILSISKGKISQKNVNWSNVKSWFITSVTSWIVLTSIRNVKKR